MFAFYFKVQVQKEAILQLGCIMLSFPPVYEHAEELTLTVLCLAIYIVSYVPSAGSAVLIAMQTCTSRAELPEGTG